MVVANLTVERGSSPHGSEDWGEYEFLGLPSPADRIMVMHDDAENFLTVLCVHHRPNLRGSGGQAWAEVVAKWTGVAPKLR